MQRGASASVVGASAAGASSVSGASSVAGASSAASGVSSVSSTGQTGVPSSQETGHAARSAAFAASVSMPQPPRRQS